MSPMRVVAIVLAAGEGRRMGGPKALIPIGDGTFLSRACRLFAQPGIASVVAVLGAEAERVRATAGIPAEATVAVNERWREGMLTSVWVGLDAAEALDAEAVLLHPVDNPFVAPATIDAVVVALANGAEIAVPSHAGRRGHPAGFARPSWPALRAAHPARTRARVLRTSSRGPVRRGRSRRSSRPRTRRSWSTRTKLSMQGSRNRRPLPSRIQYKTHCATNETTNIRIILHGV
jgi:CTP:molybdopterin cytidylyltransferase MocA